MSGDLLKYRWILTRIPKSQSRRIVLLTGARQTGKTTLARQYYSNLNYISMDAIENRESVAQLRSALWGQTIGNAVIDEAQKAPIIFEKVKYAFDQGDIDFTVLTGSSRVLLMDNVRETLAGRVFVFELWPLMASEIRSSFDQPPERPLLDRCLQSDLQLSRLFASEPEIALGEQEEQRIFAIRHLQRWGGMPELLRLSDDDRKEWLRSYQQTFLERDLRDLANIHDLTPFRKLQRLAMLRSGGLLSYSELARDAGISVDTSRRYLEYCRMSYQVLILPPFSRNLTSQVVKTPKIYWLDLGLLRQGTFQWGPMTGHMFETLALGEVNKWISTMACDAEMTFYRTRSGMEVDLLIRTPAGILGIEIKNRDILHQKDMKNLKILAAVLGREWRGGMVVYRGNRLYRMSDSTDIWAVPIHRLAG